MGNLTENFDKSEFACPCCGRVKVTKTLVNALQKLRNAIGLPIHVTSGYRCPRNNKAVGGVKKSQHLSGKAADIWVDNYIPADIASLAAKVKAFQNGGIGVYETHLHLDVRGKKARWGKPWTRRIYEGEKPC
jgi:uncharacterized protein YcbK (DUF882 family)